MKSKSHTFSEKTVSFSKRLNTKNIFVITAIFFVLFGLSAQKTFAITAPSDISGLQLWLDTSQPNSLYKDTAMTQPATVEGDKIALWADKSGNGFNATNTNATYQPLLTLNKDGGYPGVKFGASLSTLLTLGNPAALNFGNNASSTIFVVYKQTSVGSAYSGFLHKGTAGVNDRTFWLIAQADNYSVFSYLHSRSPANFGSTTASIFAYSFNPVSGTEGYEINYLNGAAIWSDSITLPTWPTATSWNIGGDTSFSLIGYIQAVYIYNRTLSATEIDSVNQYLGSRFNVPAAVSSAKQTQIVYDGNSMTIGSAGGNGSLPFSIDIYNQQSVKIPYINMGQSGWSTPMLNGIASTKVDPVYNPALTNNILVGWEGTNDIKLNDTTGLATYNNLATYYNARKAVGWKNVAVTILPRSTAQGSAHFEAYRQAANTLLRANYSQFSEALVDIGNESNMGLNGQAESTTYYLDGVHPNNTGHAVIAQYIAPAIDALVTPLTTLSSISTSTTNTSATISWTSNASSSSIVDFDLSSNYSTSTVEVDNSSTTRKIAGHSVTVSGLVPCTIYHYRVRGNRLSTTTDLVYLKNGTASSTDATFSTTGCTAATTQSTSTPSAITTAAGGSISLDTLSLTIPTSFTGTSTSANFQIKKLDSTSFIVSAGKPSGKLQASSNVFNLKALSDATTTLSTFSQALTVVMSYTSGDLTGIEESTLKIYRYDGSSWNALTGCIVNTTAKTVTCQTTAFSDFGIFGDPVVPTPTPTPTVTANTSSSGGSAQSRVNNLLAMGFYEEAQKVAKQYNIAIPKSSLAQAGLSLNPAAISGGSNVASKFTVDASIFTRTLKLGMSGSDVKALQVFLNNQGFVIAKTGVGSPGHETTYFGSLTKAALIRFQNANADAILKPQGLTEGTGFFGEGTRGFVKGKN